MKAVFKDIAEERKRQTMFQVADTKHSLNDWVAIASAYLGRASRGVPRNSADNYRDMMVKTAAIIVAAIEAYDGE